VLAHVTQQPLRNIPQGSLSKAKSPSPKILPLSPSLNARKLVRDGKRAKGKLSQETANASERVHEKHSSIVPPSARKMNSPADSNFIKILEKQKIENQMVSIRKRSPEPVIWNSSPGASRCVRKSTHTHTAPHQECKTERKEESQCTSISLADFLTPSRKQKTPLSSSSATAPWLSNTTPSSKSLMQIQAEEEHLKARQDKLYCNGGGSWFVERRERAESVLEIQKGAQMDLEHRLLVEEQMKIEAQIKEDNRIREKKEKKASQGDKKRRNSKNAKSNKSKGHRRNCKNKNEASERIKL